MDPCKTLCALDWPVAIEGHAVAEQWPLHTPFVIARGAETCITVTVVTLKADGFVGRGESCPVHHYGETTESVMGQIGEMLDALAGGTCWGELHGRFPAGAARNAVDCAVWDLVAKRSGVPAQQLLDLGSPRAVETVFTLSVGAPSAMAAAALRADGFSYLKLKLAGDGADAARLLAVREAVPDRTLIADVNEYWTPEILAEMLPTVASTRIAMLEQPLPARSDEALADIVSPVPIGADESCHVSQDLDRVTGRYQVVNIKLDKTGGMTEAVRLLRAARAEGLETMTGCMLGTSLAMAPAHLIAQHCRYVDLDAPLLIGNDRPAHLQYDFGKIAPPQSALWG